MRKLIITAIALGVALAPMTALAENITFTVPVRIENMRYLESANVDCSVSTALGAALGRQRAPVPLVNRQFNGDLSLVVALPAGRTAADATTYECALTYTFSPATVGAEFVTQAQLYEMNTHQTVATSVDSVTGPVPH